MLFSDLTLLHEHQQMSMRKDLAHKKCGFTGRVHPFWPMHSVPERTRFWTHCAGTQGAWGLCGADVTPS